MTTGFRNASGTDFDDVFDPYVQGTKPGATGFRTSDSVDLNQRFAPIVFGSAAAATGFRLSSGADVNTLWAAKGTANYKLPIDGKLYTADAARGTAALALNMNSDGTYSVQRTAPTVATLDSGTWLPSGGSVSNYTVMFGMTGFSSGPDAGGGSNAYSNGAATPSALTASRQATSSSTATTVNTNASNGGTIVIHLYLSGVEVSSTSIAFNTDATG